MRRDLRSDPLYQATRSFLSLVYAGSFGKLATVRDVRASFDGRWIAIAGDSYDALTGLPRARIALYDTDRNVLNLLSSNANDAAPRWSPHDDRLAFLSDRSSPGRYRPYCYDARSASVNGVADISDSAESISWSPDGRRLLLQCVRSGVERAGASGSGTIPYAEGDVPEWLPEIEEAVPQASARRLWICSVEGGQAESLEWIDAAVWEAGWCGNRGIVAVVSDRAREADWFSARLAFADLQRGTIETIYSPAYQIGLPCATPDGRCVAIVEGCCSDRGVVAGHVRLFDREHAWHDERIETEDVDVTFLCAQDDSWFVFAGIRDFQTAAGSLSIDGAVRVAITTDASWLRMYPGIAPLDDGEFVTVAHEYTQAPALVLYGKEKQTTLHRFAYEGSEYAAAHAGVLSRRKWSAADGLEIHGYLARPQSSGPYPLLVLLHGGPVGAYTNAWCMHSPLVPFFVDNGYAVLLPNPRGSSGRGQTFTRLVCGDMGGAEAGDILSGVDALVEEGIVDVSRVAVAGASHGGYLAAMLVAQTDRFASAVCAFPVTDLFSGHFSGTPSEGVAPFILEDPFDTHGQFFTRSPIMQAAGVHTPVLVIAGGQDRCVGVTQGVEYYRALVERGVEAELVTYAQEGHGIRNIDAYADYCTRVLQWVQSHVRATTLDRTSP